MSGSRFTLKQIEAFVSVADLGSFRRAASLLNTSQPNISSRIAQLETVMGVVLMERDAGSVRLTAKGRAMLGPARALLSAVDAFTESAGDEGLHSGILRVGVTEIVAHSWLRVFLVRMHERFPGIDVELTVDLSARLSDLLFDREIDLALQSGPFERSAGVTVPLGRAPYVWVAAPEVAAQSDAITDHPILTHARGTRPFLQIEAHFRATGVAARLVPCSNIAASLHMAQDGLGVACLPRAMVADAVAAGLLVEVAYGWRPEDLAFAARYVSDPAPAYLRGAADMARDLFPPDGA